jgi:hypothetical protein
MVEMATSEAEESGGCASILDCGELPKTVVRVDILKIRALTSVFLES